MTEEAMRMRRFPGIAFRGTTRVLVARLRSKLPVAGAPVASAGLQIAFDAFEREPEVRSRLAAWLLGDSVTLERVGFAVAA